MKFDCDDCEEEFEICDYWWGRIGENVTCTSCGSIWATDWDYTDCMEGNADAWITGKAETDNDMQPGRD